MKESEIRDPGLRIENRRLARIDQAKILAKKADFTKVLCPACARDDTRLFYERDGFTFVKCRACRTVYVNPRPTEAMLFEHYKTSLSEKYWNENIYPQSEAARVQHLVQPRVKAILDFCAKYGIATGSFMDVGAGCGTLCEQILKTGKFKKVIAVEPDPSPAQSCRDRGVEVIEDFVENVFCRDVNVATSIESIEHVFDPEKYIRSIHDALAEDGILVLTTPNVEGFDLLLLKDKSDNTAAPDHINYFHPESITLLLERLGFKVMEILTPGKLDVELVRNKVLEGQISLDENPFLKRVIVDDYEELGASFQCWLANNGLSSHMWVVARKAR